MNIKILENKDLLFYDLKKVGFNNFQSVSLFYSCYLVNPYISLKLHATIKLT